MPGHLSSNHSYMSDLRSHLLAKGPAAYEAMLDWMFEDTRNTPTAQLTRENWLCHDCIVNIMRDGLWKWWRDERALGKVLHIDHPIVPADPCRSWRFGSHGLLVCVLNYSPSSME
jgi:hypothetical protein